jgi:polyisoprenoid-binding protein YceI
MKNNLKQALILTVICIIGFCGMLQAQSVYKINDSKDIDMKLSGTSTLHKWSMDAKTFSGSADFDFKPGNAEALSSIKSLTFSLAVADLKSGESGLDKNAYKALNAKEYKDIDYKLLSATITSEGENKFLIKAHGNLTIAGVTKQVLMDVHCVVNKNGNITCTGSETLNMTDYAVKPPKFMLGAMKTGDAITLDFTLVYTKA